MPFEPAAANNLLTFEHLGVEFDQENGFGAVSDCANVLYKGWVAWIRPSTFLALCPPFGPTVEAAVDFASRPISMGFLSVGSQPDGTPSVVGHEGRHRMHWLLQRCGDEPMPVAMFPSNGDRARHITLQYLSKVARGLVREKDRSRREAGDFSAAFVPGPIFERVFIGGRDLEVPMDGPQSSDRNDGPRFEIEIPCPATPGNMGMDDIRMPSAAVLVAWVDKDSVERDADGGIAFARAGLQYRGLLPSGRPPLLDAVANAVRSAVDAAGWFPGKDWEAVGEARDFGIEFRLPEEMIDRLWPELRPAMLAWTP